MCCDYQSQGHGHSLKYNKREYRIKRSSTFSYEDPVMASAVKNLKFIKVYLNTNSQARGDSYPNSLKNKQTTKQQKNNTKFPV